METIYSSTDIYPVTKTFRIDNQVLEYGEDKTPHARLRTLIAAKFGFDEEGNYAPITDPLLADVAELIRQYSKAVAILEAISTGAFTSTETEPKYAGGVVSEGNRIFTPKEAAEKAITAIKNFS